MLIFELQDNTIKLTSKLVGSVMSATPEQYIYFMDYWEYDELSRQIRRLNNNPDCVMEKDEYQMIAVSFITASNDYEMVQHTVLDSP